MTQYGNEICESCMDKMIADEITAHKQYMLREADTLSVDMNNKIVESVESNNKSKPAINCPHCTELIEYVETIKEHYGTLGFDGSQNYDPDAYEMKYFCPKCDKEIDEIILLGFGVLPGSE